MPSTNHKDFNFVLTHQINKRRHRNLNNEMFCFIRVRNAPQNFKLD